MIPKKVIPWLLLVMLATGLAACTSKEEKSQKLFLEARQVELSGQESEAERLYREILAGYPGTPGAFEAKQRLERIELARHLALQKAVLPVFKTVKEVVQGYAAMYGRMPQSVADLDDEQFFFDSSYLEGQVPEGFRVFLSLRDGESHGGFRIWAFPEAGRVAFQDDGSGRGLSMLDKAAMRQEIHREYAEVGKRGRMTFLAPAGAYQRKADATMR